MQGKEGAIRKVHVGFYSQRVSPFIPKILTLFFFPFTSILPRGLNGKPMALTSSNTVPLMIILHLRSLVFPSRRDARFTVSPMAV
jgi:hypothetical protein